MEDDDQNAFLAMKWQITGQRACVRTERMYVRIHMETMTPYLTVLQM
jgi:hypothetical protein